MLILCWPVACFSAGSWQLGWVLCDIWISFDVLLCTASILSLCAISVDRWVLDINKNHYLPGKVPQWFILVNDNISDQYIICTGVLIAREPSVDIWLCSFTFKSNHSCLLFVICRYLAVTQPLTYSRKRRSKRLAFLMILVVWILALAITCPPMLGWWVLFTYLRALRLQVNYKLNTTYLLLLTNEWISSSPTSYYDL